ncbi:hypothetical protein [Lyngbya sp. CCY1209]|jgi:hypothetical protein|uniref:hypothetical protein n=1 Tax=Lyngbya sp. CCY1209 TaxID=2886103 RepID=UPI002D20B44F|nr:hypothetical protein [Lyngbya sp. CCY1209]MEB3885414.1 hypothetical protein [Lyngbya sp. CCY1209]
MWREKEAIAIRRLGEITDEIECARLEYSCDRVVAIGVSQITGSPTYRARWALRATLSPDAIAP